MAGRNIESRVEQSIRITAAVTDIKQKGAMKFFEQPDGLEGYVAEGSWGGNLWAPAQYGTQAIMITGTQRGTEEEWQNLYQ